METAETNGAAAEAVVEAVVDPIKASINENDGRKLFVGSLSWETDETQFKEYFTKFGPVKQATIKLDHLGRSKGFGFILFEENDSVDKVLAAESHSLGNRKIEPKRATPKEKCKKIFVGGVSPEMPEEELKKHFEQFGEIEELETPMNKEKNIRKGFIFVTFKTSDACDAATTKSNLKQQLGDRTVDVKKAVPQEQYQGGPGGRGGRGGGGPRGAPRGRGGFPGPAGYYGAPMAPPYGGYYGYDPYAGYYDPYAYAGAGYGAAMAPGKAPRGGPRGRGRGRGGRPY